jgi:hypothetical protein
LCAYLLLFALHVVITETLDTFVSALNPPSGDYHGATVERLYICAVFGGPTTMATRQAFRLLDFLLHGGGRPRDLRLEHYRHEFASWFLFSRVSTPQMAAAFPFFGDIPAWMPAGDDAVERVEYRPAYGAHRGTADFELSRSNVPPLVFCSHFLLQEPPASDSLNNALLAALRRLEDERRQLIGRAPEDIHGHLLDRETALFRMESLDERFRWFLLTMPDPAAAVGMLPSDDRLVKSVTPRRAPLNGHAREYALMRLRSPFFSLGDGRTSALKDVFEEIIRRRFGRIEEISGDEAFQILRTEEISTDFQAGVELEEVPRPGLPSRAPGRYLSTYSD